jgi:hypothetical protein
MTPLSSHILSSPFTKYRRYSCRPHSPTHGRCCPPGLIPAFDAPFLCLSDVTHSIPCSRQTRTP